MAETKRYKVGPEQGYRTETILKLSDADAKRLGLTEKNLESKVSTTADDATKADRYEEAMGRAADMRAAEDTAANEAADADADAATPDAGNKARSTRK